MYYSGILLLSSLLLCGAIDIDILSDFKMEIEFRLDKLGTEWSKRGTIAFLEKGTKNYKSSIEIKNDIMSNDVIQNIKKECELQGLYFIRFRNTKNIFYSTINPCELIHNGYRDLLTINVLSPIKEENLISINYSIDEDEYESSKSNNKFMTRAEILTVNKQSGPIFGEEKPSDEKPQAEKSQSFFSKYWWIIMIVMFMLMMKTDPGEEEGQQGQGAGQQQGTQ